MSRREKQILCDGIDRRDVGYYSTPRFVARHLVGEMLRLNPHGRKVLDPAVGKEELITDFLHAGKEVDGYDIVRYNHTYSCNFHYRDFLDDFMSNRDVLKSKAYDYIILNPPFNCHEHSSISQYKTSLKQYFGINPSNTYALFLTATIGIAKTGSIIGAILPDSFLSGRDYEALRKKILSDCSILELALCPSDLFRIQGANLSTCIIILRKGKWSQSKVKILDRLDNSADFEGTLLNGFLKESRVENLALNVGSKTILAVGIPESIRSLMGKCPRLSELFECGGGISTGNDRKYTSPLKQSRFTIPFFKNPAKNRFRFEPDTFLCDDYLGQSSANRNFIIRNRTRLKSEGIACSTIGKHFGAVYLPADTVTGIGATIWPEHHDINWLLAYLNSSLVTYIIKGILSRSIITSIGSVQSLPIPDFSESEKKSLDDVTSEVLSGNLQVQDAIDRIDSIVFKNLNLPEEDTNKIIHFRDNLAHLV